MVASNPTVETATIVDDASTKPHTEPIQGAQIGTRDKSVGWYTPALSESDLDPAVRDLLENYAHITPERVIPHILETRDQAWEICPYPCIGQLRFYGLSLYKSPLYSKVISLLSSSADNSSENLLLDLGCCFAQDLRKLAYDGVPSSRLYGLELEGGFIKLGHEFFNDKETWKGEFIVADLLASSSSPSTSTTPTPSQATDALATLPANLTHLHSKFTIIHATLFLHLFTWDQQLAVCIRIVSLLRPVPGVLVLGNQMATTKPGVYNHGMRELFKHDDASFERLWEEVGQRTGTKWSVKATMDQGLGIGEGKRAWDGGDARRLVFEIERL